MLNLKKISLATLLIVLNLNPVFAEQFNGNVNNSFQNSNKQANSVKSQISQPVTNTNAKEQIKIEIEALMPIWYSQIEVSSASRFILEKCVAQNGRVQDGFCQDELADFNLKREPAIASRDRIEYLTSLLSTNN